MSLSRKLPDSKGLTYLANNITSEFIVDEMKQILDANKLLQEGNVEYSEYVLGRNLTPDEIEKRVVLTIQPPREKLSINLGETRKLKNLTKQEKELTLSDVVREMKDMVAGILPNISTSTMEALLSEIKDVLEQNGIDTNKALRRLSNDIKFAYIEQTLQRIKGESKEGSSEEGREEKFQTPRRPPSASRTHRSKSVGSKTAVKRVDPIVIPSEEGIKLKCPVCNTILQPDSWSKHITSQNHIRNVMEEKKTSSRKLSPESEEVEEELKDLERGARRSLATPLSQASTTPTPAIPVIPKTVTPFVPTHLPSSLSTVLEEEKKKDEELEMEKLAELFHKKKIMESMKKRAKEYKKELSKETKSVEEKKTTQSTKPPKTPPSDAQSATKVEDEKTKQIREARKYWMKEILGNPKPSAQHYSSDQEFRTIFNTQRPTLQSIYWDLEKAFSQGVIPQELSEGEQKEIERKALDEYKTKALNKARKTNPEILKPQSHSDLEKYYQTYIYNKADADGRSVLDREIGDIKMMAITKAKINKGMSGHGIRRLQRRKAIKKKGKHKMSQSNRRETRNDEEGLAIILGELNLDNNNPRLIEMGRHLVSKLYSSGRLSKSEATKILKKF